jgi:hypothetical protein
MRTKKVIDLHWKQKDKLCRSFKICSGCPFEIGPTNCLKNMIIKKEIAFYKRYVAKLEKIGNKEVEL